MLAEMDAAGIAKSVLVQTFLVYGYDNSYAADTAAAHPDTLRIGVHGRRARRRCARTHALLDSRARWTGYACRIVREHGAELDRIGDAAVNPTWEAAAELDIPVCVTVKFYSVPLLAKVLARFPTLRIILDHLGAPPQTTARRFARPTRCGARGRAEPLPQADVSLIERLAKWGVAEAFLRRTIDLFGAERIAWGSNYPTSAGPLSDLVALAKRELAPFSDAERAAILGGTARSLYRTLLESDHIGTR